MAFMDFVKKKEDEGSPGIPPGNAPGPAPGPGVPPGPQAAMPDSFNKPPAPATPPPSPAPKQQPTHEPIPDMSDVEAGSDIVERVEEIAEAIIDEKWKELSKNIDKIIEWKEKTETKIVQLQEEFETVKKDFDSLHSAVLGKVGEYDQHIMSLGSEIKAMEKVFQKILPTFTENVNELSRLTKNIKKK